ncbi:unnamed protein product [Linum tenue]|uniref:Uncharacterized protein n=1 Tax=Linum tenue TaxID=586396 RepID=A0AAV0MLC1_9ROSI|nr:unnamed protein product [Linum tenue]
MATSAFKSTTRRTAIGDDSPSSSSRSSGGTSSSLHRRSRSLSRFSRPVPPQPDDFSDDGAPPRGRFVNTMRGSGVPEVTLDDLDVRFFSSGRTPLAPSRNDDPSDRSQRRGRSVSRYGSRTSLGDSKGGGVSEVRSGRAGVRAGSEANSRRRRSVSVVRYQISDSESDFDHSHPGNRTGLKSSSNGGKSSVTPSNTASSNQRPGLRRSLSQKDLKHHDGYSSHSSVLTDDEARDGTDAYSNRNGIEKTIRAVYAQKKGEHPIGEDMNSGLYEAMRKELRHAVEEIKLELEQAIGNKDTSALPSNDSTRAVSAIRRNYATKMEKSERRKQDLLAEILKEEQHGRELSKIVKELLPDPKDNVAERPLRTRKRSNDRTRMSKRLTEEAEKYIEDFISNIEDTDISSIDGERSDTSSSLVGAPKTEALQSLAVSRSRPVEMDGVVLPWLQWETSNDASSPSLLKMKDTPTIQSWEPAQLNSTPGQDLSNCSASSHGSWNPGVADCHSSSIAEAKSYHSKLSLGDTRGLTLDMDEYLKLPSEEDLLLERWMLQQRIHAGNLLLCGHTFL